MTRTELYQRLAVRELGGALEKLLQYSRDCVRLYPKSVAEADITLGSTKIGGMPDLPPGLEWPTEMITTTTTEKRFLFLNREKKIETPRSLSFIAQINFAELCVFDTGSTLPDNGILYFFYCQDQMAWGFDPADQNRFRVIYHKGDLSLLERRGFPRDIDADAKLIACGIGARSEISLPPYYHHVYDEMGKDKAEQIMDSFEGQNVNKLLGQPDVIQNEMELECELVTNGLFCGDPSGYNNPRAAQLEPNAKDWRLLLQIDSNEQNDYMWGDSGRLYFWIKEADLKARRFEKTWCILQCY